VAEHRDYVVFLQHAQSISELRFLHLSVAFAHDSLLSFGIEVVQQVAILDSVLVDLVAEVFLDILYKLADDLQTLA
jgi:hypothetical protein